MANNIEYSRQQLEELICDVMKIKTITPLIRKHINNFILIDNMTFKEIARCIVYYNEVLKAKCEPIYGLSFVLSVKERAAQYFRQLELDQRKRAEQAKKIVEYQENNIIFNIGSLQHKHRQPKQLNISEIDIEGDKND